MLTPSGGQWQRVDLPGAPRYANTDIAETDSYDSDEYMLLSSGFTEPGTLRYGNIGGEPEVLKQAPAFFDPAGLSVRQHFATSADGTAVPYFVVGPADSLAGPTLLTGTAALRSR